MSTVIHDDQRGTISPLLLLLAVALVTLGVLLAPMGVGATFRANAQTAADAAALAGAQEMRDQLYRMDHTATVSSFDWPQVCAKADDYAGRNGAEMTSCEPGAPFSVVVTVRTLDSVEAIPGRSPDPDDPDAEWRSRDYGTVAATARAEVDPGDLPPGVGGGGGGGLPPGDPHPPLLADAPETTEDRFRALVAEASRIDALQLPYLWGGGHQVPIPRNGPFDCSGAVSAVLRYGAGYDIGPAVSGQFVDWPASGPGSGKGVVIHAYEGHIFISIGGRGWGTGSAPNGGAGWLTYNSPYHGQFRTSHIPEFEDLDPKFIDEVMGEVAGGAGGGAGGGSGSGWSLGADVRLVPVDA
ncbi:MAG: hypothetical protein H0V93_04560 [Euzebyales bacterium]|nr:hypothetical protein [Euzebyales bacterium]